MSTHDVASHSRESLAALIYVYKQNQNLPVSVSNENMFTDTGYFILLFFLQAC